MLNEKMVYGTIKIKQYLPINQSTEYYIEIRASPCGRRFTNKFDNYHISVF